MKAAEARGTCVDARHTLIHVLRVVSMGIKPAHDFTGWTN
jgi:hypothetical protein